MFKSHLLNTVKEVTTDLLIDYSMFKSKDLTSTDYKKGYFKAITDTQTILNQNKSETAIKIELSKYFHRWMYIYMFDFDLDSFESGLIYAVKEITHSVYSER